MWCVEGILTVLTGDITGKNEKLKSLYFILNDN
jgi:hypothetical protein